MTSCTHLLTRCGIHSSIHVQFHLLSDADVFKMISTPVILIAIVVLPVTFSVESCSSDADCLGFQSHCMNETCACTEGFIVYPDSINCKQASCTIDGCLACESGAQLCTKCVFYLSKDRTQCLASCPSGRSRFDLTLAFLGPICTEDTDDDGKVVIENRISTDIVIGVIAGVSGALLLCVLVLIGYCIHIRRTRRNVNLNKTRYDIGNMQEGRVKKAPGYDNIGFDKAIEPSLVHNLVDRDVYLREIERLRPHAPTLLTMLNEIRHKLRAMDKSDARVPTYKGVIHQLCRVLVIIHRRDPGVSIPSDALGLMEWAHQMIEDRLLDVEPAEDSLETNPVNKISYIDIPPNSSKSNPYATPVVKKPNPYATLKRNSQLSLLNNSNLSNGSFYSSVPVPVDYNRTLEPVDQQSTYHISASQNNTLKSNAKENLKRRYEIPWDLKRYHDSFSTINCSGSDLTMGYFANGRFYDPTPRYPTVQHGPEPEVYAPVSSYSDQSNPPMFSTFTGGVQRNLSVSSNSSSNTIINDSKNQKNVFKGINPELENTDQDLDGGGSDDDDDYDDEDYPAEGLPFDINDATEPVEV
ncbi:uncharacterized protein LOC127847002 isoform X1 [Dreissena polymorpha]|uniref:uncharacterized protein LOC127847002 isoform X1 n=1 Tax=Dreissena polymorpha TaxID=45954 RepID=UPI0022644A96|nr:uncharacterized protein LOC127847002 isoform X1 [Dreissena polymorpha]